MKELPNNENGRAIMNMKLSGDNLDIERNIDFSILFRTQRNAICFVKSVKLQGVLVNFEKEKHDGFWDVTVTSMMIPSYEKISEMEEILSRISSPFGGKIDGWGCFSQGKC